jgi:GNAT superfamily N-acetyltransferase
MSRLARHARLSTLRIFVRQLGAGTWDPAGLDYRLLGERDVLPVCADPSLELAASKVKDAYRRGDLCVGAFDGAHLAGYCWFALSAAPYLNGAWLEFSSELVYTYKSYVRPAFRGRGIAAAMYRFADPVFLECGRETAIICIESHNWPSIAAARRGGFTGAGYAVCVGDARSLAWCSSKAAGCGLRFYVPASRSPMAQPA